MQLQNKTLTFFGKLLRNFFISRLTTA